MLDARLIAYLNRAAGHEMGAVQQYLAQARLCHLWGETQHTQQFSEDSREELEHLSALMDALLRLGVTPQAAQLPAVRLGRSIGEMLLIDRELEYAAIRLYEEAANYCVRRRDTHHQALFERIRDDELQHLQMLEREINQLRAA